MYIDESGDTISLNNLGKKYLVLTGCVVDEVDKVGVERRFREIKQKYYSDPDIEIKSNFLRYANPSITFSSPIKIKDRATYDALEADVADFLATIPVSVLSVVIDKNRYWMKQDFRNPYHTAYAILLDLFQKLLVERDKLGICIIDPREGRVDKSFIGLELDAIHHRLRWGWKNSHKMCKNIVERLLFATSDRTVGVQIADLYCYPIFHVYEYGKRKSEYWRFCDVTEPKLAKFYNSTTKALVEYP